VNYYKLVITNAPNEQRKIKVYITQQGAVRAARSTQCVSIKHTNRLMLHKEIMAVYCKNMSAG